MITREIQATISKHIQENKILLLNAPSFTQRRELVLNALPNQEEALVFDFTEKKTKRIFKDFSKELFFELIGDKKYIILAEAQFLVNLQELIELVLFEEYNINLICICSYDPPLDELLTEALTRNGLFIKIQAPTFKELASHIGLVQFEKTLEERLVFGNYPSVVEQAGQEIAILNTICKHISDYSFSKNERINKKEKLKKLLQYISFRIGEQVSYNEIGTKCGLDNETVERYILMLEKASILIKLPVFNTNQRYELNKSHCFYFYDNGIRNAFIQNFNPLDIRNDVNALWKNWVIAEKMEKINSEENRVYFWITHTKQTFDFIQTNATDMKAFQIIWDKSDKFKVPTLFQKYYPNALTYKINRASYWGFLVKD